MGLKQYHLGCLGHASYYVLKEAEVLADGLHLGPVGGRIVTEVLVGLPQSDPGSYLAVEPRWQPTLPAQRGAFRMTDFLTFAGVDPPAAANDAWCSTRRPRRTPPATRRA